MLCQLLVEHYGKTGLSVDILPHRLFSIGLQYHRKRAFMRSLLADTAAPRPVLFHWSWTAGKAEKLKFNLETGMWYLRAQCDEGAIRARAADREFLAGCCAAPVPGAHPYLLLPAALPAWATDTEGVPPAKGKPKRAEGEWGA